MPLLGSVLRHKESSPRVPLHRCFKCLYTGFPGSPELKNPSADARDTGSIPDLGGSPTPQLRPCTTAVDLCSRAQEPQLLSSRTLSVHFSSVPSLSRVRLCDSMACSTPGLPVHHQLPEFTQTHVHWVGDAIQPSHPLSSPSLPPLNLYQHQGLFKWVSSSHQVARVL